MKPSPARMAALEVVTRVRERDAYAHETLDAVLRDRALESREAALATRIAYGTIATRGTLDEALLRYVSDPTGLEPRVSDALAIAAYQLLFMRVPPHAAVSEGVELVRAHRKAAAGLANAVLRRLAADAADFPWGDPTTDVSALARQHGHPVWIAELWRAELGDEVAARVMEADNEPAPMFLAHVPTGRPLTEVIDLLRQCGARPKMCAVPGCIVVEDAAAARHSEVIAGRDVLVMDAGAQLAVHSLVEVAGNSVAEVGAGRGSKTLLAASLLESKGVSSRIVALDVHGFKLAELERSAKAMALSSIDTFVTDASETIREVGLEPASVDSVLVDAPCSGLGTLRRHPDRRWRAKPSEIESLATLGQLLLEQSSRLVRPGGFVVYSTCTVVRRENDGVIEGFLASEAGEGFVLDPLTTVVPAEWERFMQPEGWFRSLPESGGPDGHFVARVRRK